MGRGIGLDVRLRAARELAWTQHGLLTSAQLARHGVDTRTGRARLLKRGLLIQVHRGVYRLPDAPQTIRQAWFAALLRRPDGVLAACTAAHFWSLPGFDQTPLTLGITGKPSDITVNLLRTTFWEGDVVTIRGFRVTSPERTLLDLAPSLAVEPLRLMVETAWKRGLIDPMRFLRRIRDLPGQAHRTVGALRDLLLDLQNRGTPLESPLEVRFWRLLKEYGLPLPQVQVPLFDDEGELRVDFLWEHARIVVETQGRKYHLTADGFERSARRSQRLRAMGWTMVVVTWLQLEQEPAAVMARLARALSLPLAPAKPGPVLYDQEPVPPHLLALFEPDSPAANRAQPVAPTPLRR